MTLEDQEQLPRRRTAGEVLEASCSASARSMVHGRCVVWTGRNRAATTEQHRTRRTPVRTLRRSPRRCRDRCTSPRQHSARSVRTAPARSRQGRSRSTSGRRTMWRWSHTSVSASPGFVGGAGIPFVTDVNVTSLVSQADATLRWSSRHRRPWWPDQRSRRRCHMRRTRPPRRGSFAAQAPRMTTTYRCAARASVSAPVRRGDAASGPPVMADDVCVRTNDR